MDMDRSGITSGINERMELPGDSTIVVQGQCGDR